MNNHPMQPPPELVDRLRRDQHSWSADIRAAYAAGADAELEACCEWLENARNHGFDWDAATCLSVRLRTVRRSKPPSLKEQALEAQQRMWNGESTHADWELIRRAIEALPDD